MSDKIPKWLRFAAVLELLGVVFLGLSLTARHPPMYLITITGGCAFLGLGLLVFLVKIRSGLKDN